MTITGGSALPKDDIERMMRDAEAHADEDKKRREEAETRNLAESLQYQTEKFLAENGDKHPGGQEGRSSARRSTSCAAALGGCDIAAIKAAQEKVARVSQEVGGAIYAQQAGGGGRGDPPGAPGDGAGTGAPRPRRRRRRRRDRRRGPEKTADERAAGRGAPWVVIRTSGGSTRPAARSGCGRRQPAGAQRRRTGRRPQDRRASTRRRSATRRRPPRPPSAPGEGALAEQLAERTDDLQRVTAEYANYRRRVDRDRSLVVDQAAERFAPQLFPVLDDIDRARDHGDLTGAFKVGGRPLLALLDELGRAVVRRRGRPVRPDAARGGRPRHVSRT